MDYIIYDKTGTILRTVDCPPVVAAMQAKEGEFIIKGRANDLTQKIVGDKIVDKTPEEIEAENPAPPIVPVGQRPAYITNEQWQAVLKKIEALEKITKSLLEKQ